MLGVFVDWGLAGQVHVGSPSDGGQQSRAYVPALYRDQGVASKQKAPPSLNPKPEARCISP